MVVRIGSGKLIYIKGNLLEDYLGGGGGFDIIES